MSHLGESKFVDDTIFCFGRTLISKWTRPAPFIGHRQTHSEIVALKGGNTVSGELLPNTNVKTGTMISTWYCQIPNTKFQISNTNVKTRMMISTGIVKENMKPALDANIKLNLCKAVCMSRTNASGGASIFLPSGLSWWVGCPLVRVMADGSCLLS